MDLLQCSYRIVSLVFRCWLGGLKDTFKVSSASRAMALSTGIQCVPAFKSNLVSVEAVTWASQASLSGVKFRGYERSGLGLRQSLGYLRDRHVVGGRVIRSIGRRASRTCKRIGCVRMAGAEEDVAQPTKKGNTQSKNNVAEEGDTNRGGVNPVGFLKDKRIEDQSISNIYP